MTKIKSFLDFTWWLNANTTDAISNNDLLVAENVFYNSAGQLQTRRWYRTFWNQIGSSPISSYFFYQRDDNQDKIAICQSWDSMYSYDWTTWNVISWATNLMEFETLPNLSGRRVRQDYTVYKNVIYIGDWVNPYASYDGSTFSQIGVWSSNTVTADHTTETFTKVAHWLAVNDEVYFTATTSVPTGITEYQVYYVQSVPTADTFKVSLTPNGSVVSFTSNWSWTVYYNKLSEPRVRYLMINSWVCRSAWEDKNPLTLYYSDPLSGLSNLNNINTNLAIIWPSEYWIINWLHDYAQWVVTFKSEKIYYASLASGSFVSEAIDTQWWWYSDRSINIVWNALVYFSDRWIDSLNKRVGVNGAWALETLPLSEKIKELLSSIQPSYYNSNCWQYIKESSNFHFMFDTNGDDIPDTMVVYSSITWWWTTYTFPEIYDFGIYIDSDWNKQYLFASANGWQMYQYDYWYDDNGTPITATARTKNYDMWEWIFDYVEVEGWKQEGDDVDLTVYIDDVAQGSGSVADSNLIITSSLSIGVTSIGTSSLWWWDGEDWLVLYKYKVRLPMYQRWAKVSLWIQSTGVQRIFEKMTVKWNNETHEVFAYDNIL